MKVSLSYDVNDPNATRTLTVTKDVKNKEAETQAQPHQHSLKVLMDSSVIQVGRCGLENIVEKVDISALGKKINDANLSDKTQQSGQTLDRAQD